MKQSTGGEESTGDSGRQHRRARGSCQQDCVVLSILFSLCQRSTFGSLNAFNCGSYHHQQQINGRQHRTSQAQGHVVASRIVLCALNIQPDKSSKCDSMHCRPVQSTINHRHHRRHAPATSIAGLRRKKPSGLSVKPVLSTGITGQSSSRGMCCVPKECHSTQSCLRKRRSLC